MKRRQLLALSLSLPASRALAAAHPMIERSARPINEETLLSAYTERITPTESFFVRNHFDIPLVTASSYALQIDGLVEKPVTLTLPDLAAMPQTTMEAVLQCSGNGRGLFRPRVPGVQWQRGAAGNARWTGVKLKDVLARAGVKKEARFVEMQGSERPVLDKTPSFIRGIPVEKALHEDTLIALLMNDKPLPLVHGFPARLIVPGWVADDWVKWLARLTLSASEPKGFYYQVAYRVPVDATTTKAMTELVVKSLIAAPAAGAVVPPGKLTVRGVAFAGEKPVARVEVSVDGGATWADAKLERGGKYGFVAFTHVVDVAPGKLAVQARATDAGGAVQPVQAAWNPGGYLYNAIDSVDVEVRA